MIPTISASSVKEFDSCAMKWYRRKILGEVQPPTAGTRRGQRAHALFEAGVRGREIRNPRVRAALALVPPILTDIPDPKVWIEGRLPDFRAAGVRVDGRFDLAWAGAKRATVVDLKTTASKRYALNEIRLPIDTQALIYAQSLFETVPTLEEVELCWIYTQTKGAVKAWRVEGRITRAEARERFAAIEASAERMSATAGLPLESVPKADPLAPNSACKAYGGCPYFAKCWSTQPAPAREAPQVEDWSMGLSSGTGLRLFVDIAPIKPPGSGTRLEDYLAPLVDKIAMDAKVPDFRLVPYAGWKGQLAAAINANPPKGDVFAMRSNETTNLAIEVLTPHAEAIYIGTR